MNGHDDVLQYAEVCKFREELESKGTVCKYTGVRGSKESFFEKVSVHLTNLAARIAKQQVAPATGKRTVKKKSPKRAAKKPNSILIF